MNMTKKTNISTVTNSNYKTVTCGGGNNFNNEYMELFSSVI